MIVESGGHESVESAAKPLTSPAAASTKEIHSGRGLRDARMGARRKTATTSGATVTTAPKRLTAMPAAKANAAVATGGNDLIRIASGRDHASVLFPASFEQFTLIAVGEPAALLAILLQEPIT